MAYLVSLNGTNVVFLGDMARSGGENLMANVDLGALNCTMVQMAHHGQNGLITKFTRRSVHPYACGPHLSGFGIMTTAAEQEPDRGKPRNP